MRAELNVFRPGARVGPEEPSTLVGQYEPALLWLVAPDEVRAFVLGERCDACKQLAAA